MVVLLCFLF